jgi:hypothetical protein
MSWDDHSKSRQRKGKKQSEPFIQISDLVLTSEAYKDLGFSARSMLIEMVKYYNGRNNGYIFISKQVLKSRGFSKNTATKALKELISHGLIYMTKKGGNLNGGCSWYAITWLQINRMEGQHLENFVANAYAKWLPIEKNHRSKIGSAQHQTLGIAKFEATPSEFMPYINQSVRLKQLVAFNPNICDL